MRVRKIVNRVTKKLGVIIDAYEPALKEGSFKVRPGYGYNKFYLNSVDGGYDMSLEGLIHHLMYAEGIYRMFLNAEQYADLERVVSEFPEQIYGPDIDDPEYDRVQYEFLDHIYYDSCKFVGQKLRDMGLDVETEFERFFDE